jgi:hypothetical protein
MPRQSVCYCCISGRQLLARRSIFQAFVAHRLLATGIRNCGILFERSSLYVAVFYVHTHCRCTPSSFTTMCPLLLFSEGGKCHRSVLYYLNLLLCTMDNFIEFYRYAARRYPRQAARPDTLELCDYCIIVVGCTYILCRCCAVLSAAW